MFAQAMMDLRVARRAFVRQPLFTAVIVATLALGIGATVAMFGVVDAAVLRPVRVPDADRIVSLARKDQRFGTAPLGPPYLADLRERMRGIEQIAGFSPSWQFVMTGSGDPRVVTGAYVSDGLFDLFHVTPVHGRTFVADEYAPGGPPVVMVSEAFWRRSFGAVHRTGRPYGWMGSRTRSSARCRLTSGCPSPHPPCRESRPAPRSGCPFR